ncbi:hypothetical protein, partial [Adlercreutzia sp.]|uniref:hypothetical protein n=1 Tax=Adlercreutzia sp. TaxID=1872387 RepID=UPI003A8A8304
DLLLPQIGAYTPSPRRAPFANPEHERGFCQATAAFPTKSPLWLRVETQKGAKTRSQTWVFAKAA